MKSKDLIKQLQKLDPSGELEVFLNDGRGCIVYAREMDWYYDGRRFIIHREYDEKGRVQRKWAEALISGCKIYLHSEDIEDLLYDDIDAHIDCKGSEQHEKVLKWAKEEVLKEQALYEKHSE